MPNTWQLSDGRSAHDGGHKIVVVAEVRLLGYPVLLRQQTELPQNPLHSPCFSAPPLTASQRLPHITQSSRTWRAARRTTALLGASTASLPQPHPASSWGKCQNCAWDPLSDMLLTAVCYVTLGHTALSVPSYSPYFCGFEGVSLPYETWWRLKHGNCSTCSAAADLRRP